MTLCTYNYKPLCNVQSLSVCLSTIASLVDNSLQLSKFFSASKSRKSFNLFSDKQKRGGLWPTFYLTTRLELCAALNFQSQTRAESG